MLGQMALVLKRIAHRRPEGKASEMQAATSLLIASVRRDLLEGKAVDFGSRASGRYLTNCMPSARLSLINDIQCKLTTLRVACSLDK
jgi:hypothetical protein